MTTLREVKEFLEIVKETDSSFQFLNAFNNPHSWRGSYDQVSFEPTWRVMTAAEILAVINEAVAEPFQPEKGWWYVYNLNNHGHLDVGGNADAENFTKLFEQMKADFRNRKPIESIKKPRITKAEKKAAAEQLRKEEEEKQAAEFRLNYHHNLLSLIADHMTMNWRVMMENGEFKFDVSPKTFPTVLPDDLTYQEICDFVESMEDVRYSMNKAIQQIKEQEIRFAKKQAALGKLSKEERELLGLL